MGFLILTHNGQRTIFGSAPRSHYMVNDSPASVENIAIDEAEKREVDYIGSLIGEIESTVEVLAEQFKGIKEDAKKLGGE